MELEIAISGGRMVTNLISTKILLAGVPLKWSMGFQCACMI